MLNSPRLDARKYAPYQTCDSENKCRYLSFDNEATCSARAKGGWREFELPALSVDFFMSALLRRNE